MKRIFISYTSSDMDFAFQLYNDMTEAGIKADIDELSIDPGEDIFQKITAILNRIDAIIVILSANSVKSKWVEYELKHALKREIEEEDIDLIPLQIEDCELPEYIKNKKIADFRNPMNYDDNFSLLLNKLKYKEDNKNNKVDAKTHASSIRRPLDLFGLQRMIKSTIQFELTEVIDRISDIAKALKGQKHILTPEGISIEESESIGEIWVITTHLYNDIFDKDIRKSVMKNLKRGVNYIYFVNDTNLIKRRKVKYENRYKEHSKNYRFITPPTMMIMPFDEIVIYDPEDDAHKWGYVQIKYRDEDLFLKLSDANLAAIIRDLLPSYTDDLRD